MSLNWVIFNSLLNSINWNVFSVSLLVHLRNVLGLIFNGIVVSYSSLARDILYDFLFLILKD